jgi:hypothetical protein
LDLSNSKCGEKQARLVGPFHLDLSGSSYLLPFQTERTWPRFFVADFYW